MSLRWSKAMKRRKCRCRPVCAKTAGWKLKAPDLKEGDAVVTVGAYGLPEKTKIRVENSPGEETIHQFRR